jgi:hypothetical protein
VDPIEQSVKRPPIEAHPAGVDDFVAGSTVDVLAFTVDADVGLGNSDGLAASVTDVFRRFGHGFSPWAHAMDDTIVHQRPRWVPAIQSASYSSNNAWLPRPNPPKHGKNISNAPMTR